LRQPVRSSEPSKNFKEKCDPETEGENKRYQKARRVKTDWSCRSIWNWELIEMYTLKSVEIVILTHLYEKGIVGINGGWEKQSELDNDVVEELYRAKLVDKSTTKGFIRLSERGVGAVLFGLQNADKISEFL
jgi:hypothetical protein